MGAAAAWGEVPPAPWLPLDKTSRRTLPGSGSSLSRVPAHQQTRFITRWQLPHITGRSPQVQQGTKGELPTCSLPLAQLPRMLPPLRIVLLLWLLLLIPSAPTLLLRFTRLFFTPGANLVREQPLYGIPEPPAHTCVDKCMHMGQGSLPVAVNAGG